MLSDWMMDWADGDSRHEGVHATGCKDIRDADPIADTSELNQLVVIDSRFVFPCARKTVKEALGGARLPHSALIKGAL